MMKNYPMVKIDTWEASEWGDNWFEQNRTAYII